LFDSHVELLKQQLKSKKSFQKQRFHPIFGAWKFLGKEIKKLVSKVKLEVFDEIRTQFLKISDLLGE